MAIVAPVQDGKVVDTSASNQSLSDKTKTSNSSLDKEAFLQLLVAQMKYQDPLEPTSNTEYISQLATFSSLEEMQNLNSTMQTSQATSLVGKIVTVRKLEADGSVGYETGEVEFLVRENGKTYLSINGGTYSIEDLDMVIDEEYLDATNSATAFQYMIAKLPNVKQLSLSDKDKLEEVRKYYDDLSDYGKQYISKYVDKVYMEKLLALEEEMKRLVELAGGEEANPEPDNTNPEPDNTNPDQDNTN